MKLKLDENLGERGLAILRDAGHDISTVLHQELTSATDEQLIERCGKEGRALVTLDLDFASPLRFRPSRYAGSPYFVCRSNPPPAIWRVASEHSSALWPGFRVYPARPWAN